MNLLVEVLNAEQAKMIAVAETATQQAKNKKLELEVQSRGKAILTEREAEAGRQFRSLHAA